MKVYIQKLGTALAIMLLLMTFGAAAQAEGELLNVNGASIGQLAQLPGMTEELAMNVVLYREIMGDLMSLDEFLTIDGFTQAIVDQISPHILVEAVGIDCGC